MKRLIGYNPTEFFFDDSTTNQEIADWVSNNLRLFDLNEHISCEVKLNNNSFISISGDEDFKDFEITFVEPIKILLT